MVTKDSVQSACRAAFKAANYWGMAAIATGVGKSKIAIDEAVAAVELNPKAIIVLVVPTRKLRDQNWESEFAKWGQLEIYKKNVHRICYKSIHKLVNSKLTLLILDEGHNLTDKAADVFRNNRIARLIVLTATPPDKKYGDTDKEKIKLFNKLKIPLFFHYSLDQAVKDGLVAPYEMRIVECSLDNTSKYIKCGKPAAPFYQTERQKYDYLTSSILNLQMEGKDAQWKILERMRLVKNLRSKTLIARAIIDKWILPEDRFLIFCGSIEQCDDLGGKKTYHSKVSADALNAFQDLELNHLYVVDAANEGLNLPEVNGGFIVQLGANGRTLVQRLGRTIRARPGHKAIVWILVAKESVDEDWLNSAIGDLDKSRITYIHYKNVI